MDAVRQRHYSSLEENLAIIAEAARSGANLHAMPFNLTVPLQVERFRDVLREGGLDVPVAGTGLQTAAGLYDFVRQRKTDVNAAMDRIVANKRATMRTSEGFKLTADELWRALEFFNEVARMVRIIITQDELDSPDQHPNPNVGTIADHVGVVRK